MKRRSASLSSTVSVLGLIVVLGVAWGFDAWMELLSHRNAQTFSLAWVIFWSYPLIAIFLAAILLLLAWFVLSQASKNVWISLVFLIVGLFIVIYPALVFTPALCCWMPYIGPLQLSQTKYLFSAGGFVAIIGLFSLILPNKNRNDLPR